MGSAMLAFLLVLTTVSTGEAKSVRVRVLDADLTRLPFAEGMEAAIKWVATKIRAQHAPRLQRAIDRGDRQRVNREIDAAIAKAKASHVELKGEAAGLESSVIGDEFVGGVGESLIQFRSGEVSHFLFFTDGKLWKYARGLPVKGEFQARLTRLGRDFGPPTQLVSHAGSPTGARWEGDKVDLRVTNKRPVFGADLLLISHRAMTRKAEERRKRKPVATKSQVDPELDGILDD